MQICELENNDNSLETFADKYQLREYVTRLTESAVNSGHAKRDQLDTRERLKLRQEEIRSYFIDSIGGLPDCSSPLNARTVNRIQEDGFRIENILYESRPGHYVTSNLYIPDDVTAPRGAVLFLCGHFHQGRLADEYQVVCRYLVRSGLIVLAQDPPGQGERQAYYETSLRKAVITVPTEEHDVDGVRCVLVGENICRYFVHDAMRGVDYLCSRPEVDSDRIGLTGNSGGGTQSGMLMICDPRIAAAAPATFIMSMGSYYKVGMTQDAEQIWKGFIKQGYDHEDILLMMVPRPVMVLAVTEDFFPIEGTKETVGRTRRFWEMYGTSDQPALFEERVTHHYSRNMAFEAARFLSRHLLNRSLPDEERDNYLRTIVPIDPSKLWCTVSGQVRGDIADSKFVYDAVNERLIQARKRLEADPVDRRMAEAAAWLASVVFYERGSRPANLKLSRKSLCEEFQVYEAAWWAQENIRNTGLIFRSYAHIGLTLPITVAIWEGGTTALTRYASWIRRECAKERSVLVINLTGFGRLYPHPLTSTDYYDLYGTMHKFSTDLALLDDSLAAMRTFDLLRVLDVCPDIPDTSADDIAFFSDGIYNGYTEVAAFMDERICRVDVENGIFSYADFVRNRYYNRLNVHSLLYPGMLKHVDLPDIREFLHGRIRFNPV